MVDGLKLPEKVSMALSPLTGMGLGQCWAHLPEWVSVVLSPFTEMGKRGVKLKHKLLLIVSVVQHNKAIFTDCIFIRYKIIA